MWLSYLGMGRDLTTMGFVWYYMNILAIAGIIYMLLKLAIARAERVVTNRSESALKEERFMTRIVMFAAIFGIMFFFMREYVEEMKEAWKWATETIQGVYNGE